MSKLSHAYRIVFLALVTLSISCSTHEGLALDAVSELPSFFSEEIHFGSDLKSLQERNNFLFITGYIDTTSEFPPQRFGVISVGGKTIYLSLKQSHTIDNDVSQRYSTKGYVIDLKYAVKKVANHSDLYEGTLVVRAGAKKEQYDVVGTAGYH